MNPIASVRLTTVLTTVLAGLALSTPAAAMDCSKISFTDTKNFCESMFQRGDDGFVGRSSFSISECSTIRNPVLKGSCYAFAGKASDCENKVQADDEFDDSHVDRFCYEVVSMGRKLRTGASSSGTCSLGDPNLDAWCDAFKSGNDMECSTLQSNDRRLCSGAMEVVADYRSKPKGWEKIRMAVPEVAEEARVARDSERREEERAKDLYAESCRTDMAMAPLPPGTDRKTYTREEYAKIWAKHQGRSLSWRQARTLMRGCIGIVAANLSGGGNPLDEAEALFSSYSQAKAFMDKGNALLDWLGERDNPAAKWLVGDESARDIASGKVRYVMFGKLFWSNQTGSDRTKPDDEAFPSDSRTGEIDLRDFRNNYHYRAQPGGYINFDYAFYDEGSNSFWHANHMEYSDPEKRESDPMKVYQSTPSSFAAGYKDFDRVVYGVALAKTFEAKTTATFWGRKLRR